MSKWFNMVSKCIQKASQSGLRCLSATPQSGGSPRPRKRCLEWMWPCRQTVDRPGSPAECHANARPPPGSGPQSSGPAASCRYFGSATLLRALPMSLEAPCWLPSSPAGRRERRIHSLGPRAVKAFPSSAKSKTLQRARTCQVPSRTRQSIRGTGLISAKACRTCALKSGQLWSTH